MGTADMLIARVRAIDLVLADRIVAVLFTIGAIADAVSQPYSAGGALAIGCLVVLMGSIAWRRAEPVWTTLVAVSALIVFEVASRYNGDGSFEVAAIALNFYTLGRRAHGRGQLAVLAGVFGYWLIGVIVITYVPTGGTLGNVLGGWALVGVLPFTVGRTLARRSAMASRLEAGAARLREEQEISARLAAVEERSRMARELHDVIAHCVSVMVVQTGAARRVVGSDIDAARDALRAVESSGREALVELRRLVGVLRRGSDDLAGFAVPGLAQLGALADRSCAAGLPVEVHVAGRPAVLAPDVDLVAYRVVQEALTNAIKHAGPARAKVSVEIGDRELQLRVSDTGGGPAFGHSERNGSGHGLVGMAERVKLYGGELHVGPGVGGGLEVSACIPLDANAASPQTVSSQTSTGSVIVETEAPFRWPSLDPAVAVASLAVLEIAVLSTSHRRGPLALSVAIAAGIALAAVWRRRSPLLFLVVVGVLGWVMNMYLVSLKSSPLIGAYFALVPSYAVAAWAERRQAVFGLLVLVGGAAVSELITARGSAGDFAGAAFTVTAAWAAGRAVRSYRLLTSELERTTARLATERDDRARLAVAGERSRVARELHAGIARSVAAMVVQSEAALRLLVREPEEADAAMDTIEHTGRLALAEMRRVLGVLRHGEARADLRPQPGADQIYALIQRARDRGQPVELTIEGDAGTLAPGIEVGLYRILENALEDSELQNEGPIGVCLQFGERDLELRLTARRDGPNGWPTDAIRERVALCGGELYSGTDGTGGWQLTARLPRGLLEALQ